MLNNGLYNVVYFPPEGHKFTYRILMKFGNLQPDSSASLS